MGEPGAGSELLCPAQFDCLVTGLIRQQFDVVMLTNPSALLFEAADAFLEFGQVFLGAGFC